MGADGFLPKPFKNEDLLKLVKTCSGHVSIEPEKKVSSDPILPAGATLDQKLSDGHSDRKYCKLSINDFVCGKLIRYRIFVKLSETKYVKVAYQGEDLSVERIQKYRAEGLLYFYLEEKDFYEYFKQSLLLSQAVHVHKNTISKDKRVSLLRHTNEVYLEYIYSHELDQERLSDAHAIAENTVRFLAEETETFDLLFALNSHADFLYAHSLGVSIYAVMIARGMGWNSHGTLFKVAMAGLLHDIGLKEVELSILRKSRLHLSADEIKAFETHPLRGMEILSKLSSIPSDLIQIILHHHERASGSGFPNHLRTSKIHPLASLVAVADEFCEMVIKNPSCQGRTPQQALTLISIRDNGLNQDLVRALGQIIKSPLKVEPPSK